MSFLVRLIDFFCPMGSIGTGDSLFYGILYSAALYYDKREEESREAANVLSGFFARKRGYSLWRRNGLFSWKGGLS